MKTETLEQKINSILSPVHLPTVHEWLQIAEIKLVNFGNQLSGETTRLMQRFESLTRGKWVEIPNSETGNNVIEWTDKVWQPALLTKEMFCNPIEKPKGYELVEKQGQTGIVNYDLIDDDFKEHEEYNKADAKVWFEGFNEAGYNKTTQVAIYQNRHKDWIIEFNGWGAGLTVNATVFDLIYEIDLFNRTASQKILVNYSENFIKELLK